MTNDPHTPNGAEPGPVDAAAEAATTEDAARRLADLEAEKIDLKDKLLRTLADMENMRRRTEREIADSRTYAVTAFARDMLTVSDNLRRALDSVPADLGDNARTLLDGIELTEKDLLKTLERHGVKKLNPEGGRFDPNMHQAMFEVPSDTVASGTVMQVVQTGYAIGERVLRPAMVGVARNTAKAAPATGDGETGPAAA